MIDLEDRETIENCRMWLRNNAFPVGSGVDFGDLVRRAEMLARELRAARALRDYVEHSSGCNYPHGAEYGCKCGYLRTIDAYDRAVAETP